MPVESSPSSGILLLYLPELNFYIFLLMELRGFSGNLDLKLLIGGQLVLMLLLEPREPLRQPVHLSLYQGCIISLLTLDALQCTENVVS